MSNKVTDYDNESLVITPRLILEGCSMEFIFKYKQGIQYLLEGHGYLKTDWYGNILTNYGDGSYVLTDLETGNNVKTCSGGRTYKLVIPNAYVGPDSTRSIRRIGSRFDDLHEWLGIFHSIKITNLMCGYDPTIESNSGKRAGLFLQFDRIIDKTIPKPDVYNNTGFVDSEDPIEEIILGDPVNSDNAWDYNEADNSWTRKDIAEWNKRLHLMPSELSELGQKNYGRVLKVSFDAIIPEGKAMRIFYANPSPSNKYTTCVNGKNVHYIHVNGRGNDRERPYFDEINGAGCVISNLVVSEYHGVAFSNLEWTKIDV